MKLGTKKRGARRVSRKQPGRGRSRLGDDLLEGLNELRDALASGRPLADQLTVRTVRMPDPPRRYDAAAVRATRRRLNVSQAVFAQLLGVSEVLVRSWERSARTPAPLARRLLDEINRDPQRWTDMVRATA